MASIIENLDARKTGDTLTETKPVLVTSLRKQIERLDDEIEKISDEKLNRTSEDSTKSRVKKNAGDFQRQLEEIAQELDQKLDSIEKHNNLDTKTGMISLKFEVPSDQSD